MLFKMNGRGYVGKGYFFAKMLCNKFFDILDMRILVISRRFDKLIIKIEKNVQVSTPMIPSSLTTLIKVNPFFCLH